MNKLRPSDRLLQALDRYLTDYGIRDTAIVCALSGGADSVALLWALSTRCAAFCLTLSALHVHHGIRGAEADRDEAFCRALCRSWEIPLLIEHVDAPRYAEREHVSLETAARLLRYEVFSRVQEAQRALVATAHNAGDQAETVLFRIARGTGLTGLAGIPPMREGVIRPLLSVTPEDVRGALAEQGISHVEDSTNADVAYTRNYIRAEITPRLERLYPRATEHIAEMADGLRRDMDYLEGEARRVLGETPIGELRHRMRRLHPALTTRMIRILYERVRRSADALTAEQVAAVESIVRGTRSRASVDLPVGIMATVEGDAFLVSEKQVATEPPRQSLHEGFNLLVGRHACLVLSRAPIDVRSLPEMKVYNSVISVSFSTATIISSLYVRSRREGDAYRYGGMTRKVKKLFCDAKMTASDRLLCPLLCDEAGIIWIPGFGVRDVVDGQQENQYYAYYATQEDDK